MSVDRATVKRVAHLARIAVDESELDHLGAEINAILAFVDELGSVDVSGVEPMTSVLPMALRRRPDAVTDGGDAERVLANAPVRDEDFFTVPKVVE